MNIKRESNLNYFSNENDKLKKVLKETEIVSESNFIKQKMKEKNSLKLDNSVFAQLRKELQNSVNVIEEMNKLTLSKKNQKKSLLNLKIVPEDKLNNKSEQVSIGSLNNLNKLVKKTTTNQRDSNLVSNTFLTLGSQQSNMYNKKISINYISSRNLGTLNKGKKNSSVLITDISSKQANQSTNIHDATIQTAGSIKNNEFSEDENASDNPINRSQANLSKKEISVIKPIIRKEEKKRLRTFTVKLIKNYYEKNKLSNKVLPKSIITDMEYQFRVISDEIIVLLDRCETFRLMFLTNEKMTNIYSSLSKEYKKQLNTVLEESCGLIMEISIIILNDFAKYLDKFVAFPPPSKDRLKDCYISNEEINFSINSKLFSDIAMFAKCCFEVYTVLVKQEDDITLDCKKYNEVTQYLSRARHNISILIESCKSFFKNHDDDVKVLEKFLKDRDSNKIDESGENLKTYTYTVSSTKNKFKLSKIIKLDKDKKKENLNDSIEEEMEKVRHNKKPKNISNKYKSTFKRIPDRQYMDLSEKIKAQFTYKMNERTQRMKQLNNLLNKKEDNTNFYDKLKRKYYNEGESCLSSCLINKMMKFIPKHFKERIISQRIIERFKERNNSSDEDD